METQNLIIKKDAVQEFFDKTYNLAIDHAIETVRKSLTGDLAEVIVFKLEKLKS